MEKLNRHCGSGLGQWIVHVQALDGKVHHRDNGYLDWLFHENVFPLRESTSIMFAKAKDSHLTNHLEVHSPSFDQVFLSIQLKTC